MLAHESDDRATDRRRADEGDGPQRHDTTPHRVLRRELERRVAPRHERDARCPDTAEHHELDREARCQRRGEEAQPESARGDGDCTKPGRPAARDDEAADDSTGAERGGEEAVAVRGLVEGLLGEHGQHYLELIGERADERHHHERDEQPRRAADVPEALDDLPRPMGDRLSADEVGGVHSQKGHEDRDEGECVDQETHADADCHDEDSGDRGTDRTGAVRHHAVQRDGVRHRLGADHLGDEGLPGGIVNGVHEPEAPRDREDHPQPHRVRDDEETEDKCEQAEGGLGGEQDPPLVEAIGGETPVRS